MEPDIDPIYEYNAPRFVNFLNMDEDENVDEWFDQKEDDEGGFPFEPSVSSAVVQDPNRIREYLGRIGLPSANTEATPNTEETLKLDAIKVKIESSQTSVSQTCNYEHQMETDAAEENDRSCQVEAEKKCVVIKNEQTVVSEKEKPPPRKVRNIVSLEEWNKKTTKVVAAPAATRPSLRQSKRKRPSQDKHSELGSSGGVQKRRSVDSSSSSFSSRSGKDRRSAPVVTAVNELTIPKTPEVLKRQTNFTKPVIKSSEQLELEKIEKERKEVARRKERLMNYYKNKALHPTSLEPVRSTQGLTLPEEFHLKTDERVKQHPQPSKPGTREVPRTFPEYLRVNDTETKQWKNNGPTIAKPFSFDKSKSLPNSRKSVESNHSSDVDKWKNRAPTKPVPFSFDKETSAKKKTCDEPSKDDSIHVDSWKNRGPTKPMPFSFDQHSTESRKRKLHDVTDHESDSYESVAKSVYHFQSATPLRFRSHPAADQNIGPVSLDNREEMKLTEPKTPKLSSQKRMRPASSEVLSKEQREEKEIEEMKSYHFKAKEFNKQIVECNGILGVPRVARKAATVPNEFHFSYDERAEIHKHKDVSIEEEVKPVIKALAVPHSVYEEPKKPELGHKKTETVPFSFEQRDRERSMHKEAKIKETFERERKLREFHAQPLPSLSPVVLEKQVIPATKCKPFNIDTRGALRAKEWAEKVEMELQEQRKKATFKAHPCNVLHSDPFVPKKSTRPLTDVSEFKLNVDRRAMEWDENETKKKEKEAISEEIQRQRQLEMDEEELKNIAILRKNLVHKANPVKKFKKVHIKPSGAPLTNPMSPAWSENKRAKLR